jgi:hypothetical protein
MPKLPAIQTRQRQAQTNRSHPEEKRRKAFCLLAAALAVTIADTAAADTTLKHVVLSSGGVGLFAFEAQADGAATLRLSVKLDQVDDILKSLTVTDPAGPMVSLRLAGREPLAESFKTLPFQPQDFASAEALLGALVGEPVRIPLTGASGNILAVSSFQQSAGANQPGVERHRLTIATRQGIETVVLEDTPAIEFVSEKLRAQVASALSAIAAQRVQDKRTLEITLAQGGQRTVQIAYVVQAPVWKTTYRITLPPEQSPPAGAEPQAHLQAYAVIENLSGLDWNNVDVDLTSGRPALFHTPLYQALYLNRPEAPVDIPGVVAPPPDNAAPVAMAAEAAPSPMSAPSPPPSLPPPQGLIMPPPGAAGSAAGRMRFSAGKAAAEPPPPSEIQTSVAQVDFHLAAPITADSGQSLLVPVIDRKLPAERIALYNAATDADHPLVALQITNDSPGALPPGVITLFQDRANGAGYIGDARIATIEPGETRFASFAADLPVSISHDSTEHADLVAVKAANGSLTLTQQTFTTIGYTIIMPKSAGRKLVIETPRVEHATVTEPKSGVSLTDDAVRVTADIPPGETRTIRVTQKTQNNEERSLTPDDVTDFAYLATSDNIPQQVRDAMRKALDLRSAVDIQQRALDKLQTEQASIDKDQQRIRQNIIAVPPNSDLHRRYLATMSAQETRLGTLRDEQAATQAKLDDAQKNLSDYLANLTI